MGDTRIHKNELIDALVYLIYPILANSENKRVFIINKARSGCLSRDEYRRIVFCVNNLLEGNAIKGINFQESALPRNKIEKLWREIYGQFCFLPDKYHTIVNLLNESSDDEPSDIECFETYVEGEIKNCSVVSIDIHSDCSQLVDHIKEVGCFGHLIINTSKNNPYIEALRRTGYYESISMIDSASSKKQISFDPRKNLMKIEGKTISPMYSWSEIYLNSVKSFFSYSSKDDLWSVMDDINKCITRYFPFIRKIHTDKDMEYQDADINKYVHDLVNGKNLVFFIIGENYLKSFYSAQELLQTFEKYDLLGKTSSELKESGLVEKLIRNGRFIMLRCKKTADRIRSIDNNEIKDYWLCEQSNNQNLLYSQEQIKHLFENLDSIKEVFRSLNKQTYLCDYYDERYRGIVKPISLYTSRQVTVR
jgi:hypothetical protein